MGFLFIFSGERGFDMSETLVHYWGEMTAHEITAYIKKNTNRGLVIIPLGVVEAHGPFMPLGFDVKIAQLVSHLAAEYLAAQGVDTLIYDEVSSLGIVSATWELDGTIALDAIVTTEILFQSIKCMYQQGIRHFCIINGDGGTGDQWRGLLFFGRHDRREFFRELQDAGSLDFISWFDGMDRLGHACPYEHATLKFVCDLADEHVRMVAERIGLSARLLTEANMLSIDGVRRIYPQPRREYISWRGLSGQIACGGISYFSYDEYTALTTGGKMAEVWKNQMAKVYNHLLVRARQFLEV